MARKLKIVFVLGAHGVAPNGGFRIIAGYAERLRARGHEVTIVAPGGAPQNPRKLTRKIRHWRNRIFRRVKHSPRPFLEHADVKISIVKGKRALASEDIPKADILVATWWETAEWVFASPQQCAKVHLVQDYEVFPYLPVGRVHAVYKLPLKKIVVSHWLKDRMKEAYGVNDAVLIENAVAFDQFKAEAREKSAQPTVGFVYSDALRKNTPLAIEVCRELKRRIPRIRARSFGSTLPAASRKTPKWIDYALAPNEARIRDIYSACDVWLFTSDNEGFGLPILEAMACGTPVVATRAGAAPQIVNARNGALVAGDRLEIAAAAQRILELSPARWRMMSDAAIATARRRNWTSATDEMEEAFYRAVKDAKPEECVNN